MGAVDMAKTRIVVGRACTISSRSADCRFDDPSARNRASVKVTGAATFAVFGVPSIGVCLTADYGFAESGHPARS
jgi:hypothetical protein